MDRPGELAARVSAVSGNSGWQAGLTELAHGATMVHE